VLSLPAPPSRSPWRLRKRRQISSSSSPARGPLANALILPAAAALGAAFLGGPFGYVLTRTRLAGVLDAVAMVPFAVAGTVLGIGLVIAFNSGVREGRGGVAASPPNARSVPDDQFIVSILDQFIVAILPLASMSTLTFLPFFVAIAV